MSPPISQECWENNMRLYREIAKETASTAQENNAPPLGSMRPTHDVSQSPQSSIHNICPNPRSIMGHEVPGVRLSTLVPTQRPLPQPTAQAPATAAAHQHMNFIDLTESEQHLSYHIRSTREPQTRYKPCPDHITTTSPPLVQPTNPTGLRHFLSLASPEIYFVEYSCGCRNQGTCIHYHISFNRSLLPDGLVCRICKDAPERLAKGKRKCPGHQNDSGFEKNHMGSRPEDFLPTREQQERYGELMQRSWTVDWEGIAKVPERQANRRRMARRIDRRRERADAQRSGQSVADTLRKTAPGAGLGPALRGARIEPLPELAQLQSEPAMLPPSAWLTNAPGTAPMPCPEENWRFFDPSQPREKWEEGFSGADPAMLLTRHGGGGFGQSGVERQEEVMGNEMVVADLRSIENGTLYELDFSKFLGGSGQRG